MKSAAANDRASRRVASAAIGVASAALCAMALKPDSPLHHGDPSWHDRAHNNLYPLIPLCSLVAMGARSVGAGRPLERRASVAAIAIAVACLGGTAIDSIAQLARYGLFASILGWIELIATTDRATA